MVPGDKQANIWSDVYRTKRNNCFLFR